MTTPSGAPRSASTDAPDLLSRPANPRLPLLVRLVTVFVLAGAIWLLVVVLNDALFPGKVTVGSRLLNAAIVFSLSVALIFAMTRFVDRRWFRSLGLPLTKEASRPFVIGLFAFLLPSAAGLAIALIAGVATLTMTVRAPAMLASLALTCITVLIYEAIPEELIFRGYLYRNLAERLGPWAAAVLQAILFAIFGTALWVYTSGWDVLMERGLIFLGMGVVLGCLRVMSDSVWACIGFHLGFQVTAQTILGMNFSVQGPMELFVMVPPFVLATTIFAFAFKRSTASK